MTWIELMVQRDRGIKIYPDKAYIEIHGQLYNRTALQQTFLCGQILLLQLMIIRNLYFPPDVHAVMDHGKRDVSRFPIASGVYYKHDYGEGVDISRYKKHSGSHFLYGCKIRI